MYNYATNNAYEELIAEYKCKIQLWDAKSCKKINEIPLESAHATDRLLQDVHDVQIKKNKMVVLTEVRIHYARFNFLTFENTRQRTIDLNSEIQFASPEPAKHDR